MKEGVRMASMTQNTALREQYGSTEKLDIRIALHRKYSVNPQGFGSWLIEKYEFRTGGSLLEAGCGTGAMWAENRSFLDRFSRVELTDFSEAMVQRTREALGSHPALTCRTADVQALPYEDGGFDVVIANMMLYHVPDIPLALSEIRRVLRPDGVFYCATFGENTIPRVVSAMLPGLSLCLPGGNDRFTLQNGGSVLTPFFSSVARLDYPDALAVTDPFDLADYLLSLSGMADLDGLTREGLAGQLASYAEDGVISIPKEYGLFVCRP